MLFWKLAGFWVEHWHFLVDFSDIYLESIHFNLYLFLSISPATVESISPPPRAWEGYCCCSRLECLLGEEVASIRAWLLSVPGTARLHFCATDTLFGSGARLRSLHRCRRRHTGRAGSQHSIMREMSIGTDSSTLRSCCLAEMLGTAARVTASPISHWLPTSFFSF